MRRQLDRAGRTADYFKEKCGLCLLFLFPGAGVADVLDFSLQLVEFNFYLRFETIGHIEIEKTKTNYFAVVFDQQL